MPICISNSIKWSKFSSLGLCTSAYSDLVMFKMHLKLQYSALGVCPLARSDQFPPIGNVHCFYSSNEASGSDPVICDLYLFCAVCKPEVREDPWRACLWKRNAERKDVNCSGALWGGNCLLGPGSKSWTSCQISVKNHHLAIMLYSIDLDMTWTENLKWTMCLSLRSFNKIVLNF